MNALPFFKKSDKSSANPDQQLGWHKQAKAALQQALNQAPIPKLLKGRVEKELKKAAEQAAHAAKSKIVSPEHVMQGLLAKMPAKQRAQVEDAMNKGPQAIKDLEKKFKKK
jgi:hypothetical protein